MEKTKKVGILTFHRAENFGAVLQVYALQTFLRKSGFNVSVIDYKCKAIEASYHIFNPSILWSRKNIFASFKQYIGRFKTLKERRLRKKQFEVFRRDNLILTHSISKMNNIGMDAYITGSDQVWNFHLTGGFDNAYFLNFEINSDAKRIAYAVSSDNDPCNLLDNYKVKVSQALKRFDAISVREGFFKDNLSKYISKDIEICLDPTFLLKEEDYLKLAIKPKESDYVLIYHMTPAFETSLLAKRLSDKIDCKVIEAFGGYNKSTNNQFISKYHLSPAELLGYIAYAQTVVTTSFHGLALSLKLHKNVWVVNKGDNLRQRNLLSLLGIENHLVDSAKNVNLDDFIDYQKVDSKLNAAIIHSKTFLLKALK